MDTAEKLNLFKELDSRQPIITATELYDDLEKCGDLKRNYIEYMTSAPVDCDTELLRLPNADYDLCCALLTMLLREDHFSNGSLKRRQEQGYVSAIFERIITILSAENATQTFSEKALQSLNGFYVYALIDPRNDEVFYIGKGIKNRVFSHEAETDKVFKSEKTKHQRIKDIKQQGLSVKKLIVNWGLSEEEAFAAEATLINLINYVSKSQLTNIVAGHHVHKSLTTEEFELIYGASELSANDIKHSIMVIKINKLYRQNMSSAELYDVVRGFWNASLKSIQLRKVEYVFGVYNGLIVAVYKPDRWYHTYQMIDIPQKDAVSETDLKKLKNRVYFVCNDYEHLDEAGQFYIHKSIRALKVNQSAQNPISYLSPETQNRN